jgi:hypothetical protein
MPEDLLTTAPRLCHRCGTRPRRERQSYCQPCINRLKSARYWRLKAETEPRYEEVVPTIPAPLLAERPTKRCWICGTVSWWEWDVGVWRCGIDGLWA